MFDYSLTATEGAARAGTFSTPHGDVPTPAFMPVGTAGTVKGLIMEEVEDLGAQMVLANTYHLYLRPGHDLVRRLGGIHAFMRWDGPILTDSGGYQVFSLASLRTMSEQGVKFKSPHDGTPLELSPERSISIQNDLGADIIMAFDEPVAHDADHSKTARSLGLSTRWAKRCLESHATKSQALFGIVQGGMFKDLRQQSAEQIVALDFPGFAIGGLSGIE